MDKATTFVIVHDQDDNCRIGETPTSTAHMLNYIPLNMSEQQSLVSSQLIAAQKDENTIR